MRARLIAAEQKMLYTSRHCKGDASETGLVQFVQPIMDLTETRGKFPVHNFVNAAGKSTEALIPFSSEYKFNCFIRNMNTSVTDPNTAEDNLTVFLKGAPDRVFKRCNMILINGVEVPFDETLQAEVTEANNKFAELGERVLAFAKLRLDPAKYNKNGYKFDTKSWKEWAYDKKPTSLKDYDTVEGHFPMNDLVLLGLVSLNDPPRLKVDLSVNKCRSAGIKVIMVTGDQPTTAGAIANKVNIIKHPKREFSYMINKLGMNEKDAWEQSTGIVIHGDLLAEKH
jgi:sodium/potassium-transporting ATPase subunit alpha